MKQAKQQARLSKLTIVILSIAVIIAAYIGYVLYTQYKDANKEAVSTSTESIKPAPDITKPEDLDQAVNTIDDVQIESPNMDDMTEIEKELSAF